MDLKQSTSYTDNAPIDLVGEAEEASFFNTPKRCYSCIEKIIQPKSYRGLWQRAKDKIISSIRMNKIMNDIKDLESGDLSGSNISEDQLLNYLSSKTLGILETKDNGITNIMPRAIFNPKGLFISSWNTIIAIALLYIGIVTPFIIGFIDESIWDPFFSIDVILDALFFLDFFLVFNTAFFDDKNQIIAKRSLIFWNYLKGWMLIDLLSAAPFALIDTYVLDSNSKSPGKLVIISRLRNLPKLIPLIRILKMRKTIQRLQAFDVLLDIDRRLIRFIKFVFSALLALHIVACLWHFSAKVYDFEQDTWVFRYGFLDLSIWERYQNSLYWGIATLSTVGYGDIVPFTKIEKSLTMFWMIFAVYFLSIGISSLTSIINRMGSKDEIIEERLLCIDEYLKVVKLSKDVKYKLRRAIRNSSDINTISRKERTALFDILTVKMKLEIVLDMFNGIIKRFSFFRFKNEVYLASIAIYLEYFALSKSDIVWHEGEGENGIYFIIFGRVNYVYGEKNSVFRTFLDGQYFGDIEVLKEEKRKFTAVTASTVQLMILPKAIVWKIKSEFPQIWKELIILSREREKKLLNNLAEMVVIKEMNSKGKIMQITGKDAKKRVNATYDKLIENLNPKIAKEKDVYKEKLEKIEVIKY